MAVIKPVNTPHYVTYQCILPVIIVLGVISGATCFVVLRQPSLRALQTKRHFQMLALCDLILSVLYIPISFTANGCRFHTYWFAVYFAHMGWAVPAFFHSFCAYTLTWLALDRCLGVWQPDVTFMKSPKFQLLRASGTALALFLIHMPYIIDAEVLCNTSYGTHSQEVVDRDCTNGTWTSNDGFQKSFGKTWHEVVRWIYSVLLRWGPAVLLTVFNLSLVLGVLQGRVKAHATVRKGEGRESARAKRWERNLVYTMIGMAASYVFLSMPITVFLTFYGQYQDNRCYDWIPEEILRHYANLAQLVEHVLHPFFLALLMPTFRRELRRLLRKSWFRVRQLFRGITGKQESVSKSDKRPRTIHSDAYSTTNTEGICTT